MPGKQGPGLYNYKFSGEFYLSARPGIGKVCVSVCDSNMTETKHSASGEKVSLDTYYSTRSTTPSVCVRGEVMVDYIILSVHSGFLCLFVCVFVSIQMMNLQAAAHLETSRVSRHGSAASFRQSETAGHLGRSKRAPVRPALTLYVCLALRETEKRLPERDLAFKERETLHGRTIDKFPWNYCS